MKRVAALVLFVVVASVSLVLASRSCAAPDAAAPERAKPLPTTNRSSEPAPTSAPTEAERVSETSPNDGSTRSASGASKREPQVGKPIRLHVLDAESRFELSDVEVDAPAQHGFYGGWPRVPTFDAPVVLASGDSPLEVVPHLYGTQLLVVKARGYVPERFPTDWTRGGEREVGLRRGGTIELVVRGRPQRKAAYWSVASFSTMRRWIEHVVAWEHDVGGIQHYFAPTSWSRRVEAASTRLDGPIELGSCRDPSFVQAMKVVPPARAGPLDRGETTTIDGVEVGRVFVAIGLDREDEPIVAAGVVDVFGGVVNRLELEWQDVPVPPPVHVTGSVVVDPEWRHVGPLPTTCNVKARSEEGHVSPAAFESLRQRGVTSSRESGGAYAFDLGRVPPGRCLAAVAEWSFDVPFVVEPGLDEQSIELKIPPPAEVDLTLLDAQSRAPIARAQARRRHDYTLSEEGDAPARTAVVAVDGHVRFTAPIGPITVEVEPIGSNYAHHVERFDVVPGRNERTIALRVPSSLCLTLRDGDAAVPWDFDAHLVVEKDGELFSLLDASCGSDSPRLNCHVEASGRCRLSVRDVEGFEPSAPIDVDLATNEVNVVEIPLRRSR